MYGFVDTVDSGINAPLSIKTVFNDRILEDELTDDNGFFRTLQINGRADFIQRINTFEIPFKDGVYEEHSHVSEPKELYIVFQIKDDTNNGLRKRLDNLTKLLKVGTSKLEFTDENFYYNATVSELEMPTEESNDLVGTIYFYCSDPYKYAKEEYETDVTGGINTLNNKGTATAKPVLELTATKDTTYVLLENQFDEYNLIGFPLEEDGQEEIVDDRVSVFQEDGSTLSEWSTTNPHVDSNFIDIDGELSFDGSGIRVNGYGTGDKMHGPAATKELPKALQDFEINTNFDIISQRPEDNFRIEVYFHDEDMNMLGKMGIKDNNRSDKKRMALGRVGPYQGSGESNGYVIGQHNYNRVTTANNTLFNLYVKREGKLYTLYVGRWRNNKHEWVAKETYLDAEEKFSGKLKFVTIFIGNYKDRAVPNRLRINNIEVFELKQLTIDQTPYILKEGDEILIDHEEESIYINGRDAMADRKSV